MCIKGCHPRVESSINISMKVFLAILALAVASASAFDEKVFVKDLPKATKIEGRITNGYAAPEGKAPYTVGLGFSGGWWCGGSIIAHDWVLTAEHCIGDATSNS